MQKTKKLCLDIQLKLFDALVVPILLYSSEICGFENNMIIERLHLHYLKRILTIRNSTPNYMVYGETGRFPLDIYIKLRMLNFWVKLICDNKLSCQIYKLAYDLFTNNLLNFSWMQHMKILFDEMGLSYIWNSQLALSPIEIKTTLKQRLIDQFLQKWYSDMNNSSRGKLYMNLKGDFKMESYLTRLPVFHTTQICKLRCSNIKLPIETGRWEGKLREERNCHLCLDRNMIADEFHCLFLCSHADIVQLRERYIPSYYTRRPNAYKMYGLLSCCNEPVMKRLAVFINKIIKLL